MTDWQTYRNGNRSFNYHAAPTNNRALMAFRTEIAKLASGAHPMQRADESQLDSHEPAD